MTTVYTHQLAGATLAQLLEAASEDVWPNQQCEAEWVMLRNWAIQTESATIDEAENREWEQRMRDLTDRNLPYEEWVAERLRALEERTRARKLAQSNLRYKYGYRGSRRWGLLRRAVRALYLQRFDAAG